MDKTNKRSKKIRKGDKVVAIAGNYKGQSGTVLACSGERVVVQGLNIRSKHVRPNQQNQRGTILKIEAPMHVSNLKIKATDEKAVKLKVKRSNDGERQLVYKQDGNEVVYRSLKKLTK
jgi:large subunit ribosomal protein L24